MDHRSAILRLFVLQFPLVPLSLAHSWTDDIALDGALPGVYEPVVNLVQSHP